MPFPMGRLTHSYDRKCSTCGLDINGVSVLAAVLVDTASPVLPWVRQASPDGQIAGGR